MTPNIGAKWFLVVRHGSHGDVHGPHRRLASPVSAMLAYRVYPHLPGAPLGAPGHPLHLGAAGHGRLDNPEHYRIWYLALEPTGAVAEAFGDLDQWDAEMFRFPSIPGSRRALATYLLDDDIPLLDLDDARNLYARGLRPTQVIERNRPATQAWALSVYNERNDRGGRTWQGIKWWSYHQPHWRIIGYWGDKTPNLLAVEELSLANPALTDAATALKRRRGSCEPLEHASLSAPFWNQPSHALPEPRKQQHVGRAP
jgi:RES domain-containing protein